MGTLRPAKPSELTIGTRVLYRSSWGHGPMWEGEIVGGPTFEASVEEAVWDVRTDHCGYRWGYADQFFIEERAAA